MSVVYDNWFVRVAGESYGPYTHDMMSRFTAEGRVTATTEVSADPAQGWFDAQRYPQFAQWVQDGPHQVALSAQTPQTSAQTEQPVTTAEPITRHIVMAELRGGRAMEFLRVIQGYLQCTRIGDTVWLVDGAGDTNALTHALGRTLAPQDRIFVADITGQPTGQFGFREAVRSA